MKIAVCDDEEFFVEEVLEKIKSHPIEDISPNVFHGFTDEKKLMEVFNTIRYDLVFLDIELKNAKGMKIANDILEIKPDCIIIFVSSYKKYMHVIYRVNAFQFLTKPINYKLFDLELERAVKKYKHLNLSVSFQTTNGTKVIKANRIIYLQTAYGKYKLISTEDNYFGNSKTLAKVKKELLENNFYQLNRSTIINFAQVDTFTNDTIFMKNGKELHITKKKRKDFKNRYLAYIDRLED